MDYHALNRYFEPPAAPQERWAWPGSMLLAGLLAAAVIWAAKAPSPPVPGAFSAEIWSPTAQQAAPAPPPPPPPPPPAPAPAPAPAPQPAAPKAPPPAKATAPAREGDIGTEKRRKDKEPSKAEREQAEKDRQAKAAEEERRQEQLQAKQRADTLRRIREEAASATVKTEAKAAPAPAKAAPASTALPQPPSPPVTPQTPAQAPPPAQTAPPVSQQTPPQTPKATPTPPATPPAAQPAGTGASSDKGAAERSSAPSSSYVGRIVALIRDNTTFNEPNLSRYTVVVLVRTGPDGRIVKSEVVTSSGRAPFDEAVMRGIEKMVAVPKDIDGRIPELLLREGMLITVKFNR